jgi:hypothetical protein
MHRSNRTGFLLSIMFFATLGVVWAWLQDFPESIKWWSRWCLMLYGVFAGFIVWRHGLDHCRLIHDVPTSEIATAAQGYVELCGTAEQFEDQKAQQVAGLPTLWFRKEFAERADVSNIRAFPFNLFYTPTATDESQTPFSIVDNSGTACILPHGADVIVSRKNVQYLDNRRMTMETILPGDKLYVIGNFHSHASSFSNEERLQELLGKLDRDPEARIRFDRDRNGRLSPDEWREMHLHAQMTVAGEQHYSAEPGQRHLVFAPSDGRRFVISTLPAEKLAGRYFFNMTIGLMLFLACLAVLSAMTLSRLA